MKLRLITLPLLLCAAPLAAQGTSPSPPPPPDTLRGPVHPPRRGERPPPRLLGVPVAPPAGNGTVSPATSATVVSGPPPADAAHPPKVAGEVERVVYQPPAHGPAAGRAPDPAGCVVRDIARLGRNPTAAELRCRYHARGPGRFGLLSYLDVPVYQPRTPLPGTHVVGIPGMPHPAAGESYERWEWRMLHARFGPQVLNVHNQGELLDPVFASRLLQFERELRAHGVRASRRETWRSPERQAFIFQQGRSRPGPIATATLTSWHNRVDRLGRAAARAADYAVAGRDLARFHQIADSLGLEGYGADSNDPGHVYLPDTDAASAMEVAVLRLLPRVPYVTLATGRPADEQPIPGMPRYWDELAADFLARWTPLPNADTPLPLIPLGEIRIRGRRR